MNQPFSDLTIIHANKIYNINKGTFQTDEAILLGYSLLAELLGLILVDSPTQIVVDIDKLEGLDIPFDDVLRLIYSNLTIPDIQHKLSTLLGIQHVSLNGLSRLLKPSMYSDYAVKVGSEWFQLHRVILCKIPYYSSLLLGAYADSEKSESILDVDIVSREGLVGVIGVLYTGRLDLEFNLEGLSDHCTENVLGASMEGDSAGTAKKTGANTIKDMRMKSVANTRKASPPVTQKPKRTPSKSSVVTISKPPKPSDRLHSRYIAQNIEQLFKIHKTASFLCYNLPCEMIELQIIKFLDHISSCKFSCCPYLQTIAKISRYFTQVPVIAEKSRQIFQLHWETIFVSSWIDCSSENRLEFSLWFRDTLQNSNAYER